MTRLRYLAIYIGMLTALYVIISLLEVFTGNHIISVAGEKGFKYDIVPVALMDGPNENATFLTTLGIVAVGILLVGGIRKKAMRTIVLLLFVLVLPVLYYTGSRANYMAFVILIVFFTLRAGVITILKRKERIKTIVLCTTVLIILFLALFATYHAYSSKIDSTISKIIKSNFTQNESYKIRKNLLKNGLLMLKKSNYIGVGGGNIEILMPKYFKKNPTYGITNIHNYYFEMLVDYGIPGAFALLFFYCYLIAMLSQIIKANIRAISPLGMLFLCEICVSVFSFDSTSSLLTRPMIWAFQGVLAAFCIIALPFAVRQRRRKISLPKVTE